MTQQNNEEEDLMRSSALQNAQSILNARNRAEQGLARKSEELAASLAMLRATLESTTDAILVTDANGRITSYNQKFVNMWRCSPEILAAGDHQKLAEANARFFADPAGFIARVEEIYASALPDSYDLLELNDGRVLERFSNEQNLGGRSAGRVWCLRDITAQRKAADELRLQREWFQVTLSSIGDAVITTDTQALVTFLNPVAESMTGWKIADARGQPLGKIFNIINEKTRQPALNPVAKVLSEGIVVGLANHTALISRDGKSIAIEDSAAPIRDLSGAVVGAVMVFHDVTERKQAEEASLRLAAVVDSSDDAIISKTFDSIIRTWNSGAQRMFGYSAEEVIGKPVSILFPPDRLREEDEIIKRLRRGERIEHFETVRVRKDGAALDVSLAISPIKDADGNIIGASKIARDITQQRKAALALKDEAQHLEILNNTGKAIASTLDLRNLVQIVTDAGTQLSGAKFGAFFYNVVNESGESFLLYALSGAPREAFEKFGLPRNTPVFNPTFRGEGVVRSADITKDPRYGTMLPHRGMPAGHLPVRSYLAVPVISRTGEVHGGLFFGHPQTDIFTERAERLIVGIAAQAATAIDNARLYEEGKQEIAQRKAAEQKLNAAKDEAERANRAKDEFLAIVSHELRTPLTSILGWTRMLMNGSLDATKAAHGIRVIERNVKLQTQLIEDLLDVSRVVAGKLSLVMGPVDLVRVISAAIESIKPAADAKQIKLEPINESSINTVVGDSGRLQQVFWNLLANAVKFTPKGGRVEIRITRIDSTVRVAVTDSGKGIEPEFLPYLFERFRQLDSTTTRVHGGLGLGLAIVRHLVEHHGGQVGASSAGAGKGSEFFVDLPIPAVIQKEPAAADAFEAPATGPKPLAGIRVLAVEDETDSRDLILTVLESAGASGVGVASADEALSEIDRRMPDAIVSDIGMPMKDGYQFISELRAREAGRGGKIPVLALTAFAREEDRVLAIKAGFDMYVPKPIDPDELITRVAQIVRR